MKRTTLLYNCKVWDSKILLRIDHWFVADYPISFTPQECLEEFCESVGWKLVVCFGQQKILNGLSVRYSEFEFEGPYFESIIGTLCDTSLAYNNRPDVGAVF